MSEIERVKADLEKQTGLDLYSFSIGGKDYVFRALTIKELKPAYAGNFDIAELEDHYVSACVLYPEDFNINKTKAGYITRLADEILRISGFDDINVINQQLADHREVFNSNVIQNMKAYVITAMPAYKEEDLDNLSMNDLMHKVVLSESIITIQQRTAGLETEGFKLIITSLEDQDTEKAVDPLEKLSSAQKRDLMRKLPKNLRDEIDPDYVPPALRNLRDQAPKKLPTAQEMKAMSDSEYEAQKMNEIARIRGENNSLAYGSDKVNPALDGIEEMSLEDLKKIQGRAAADDPINARLRANEGKVASTARSMGLPYE